MTRYSLHESIKQVFNQLGIESMLTTKITYALMDYGAFDEFPSSRQIIRDIIVEGYSQKLYDIYKADHPNKSFFKGLFTTQQSTDWTPIVQTYIADFIKKSGYNDDLVNYCFHTLLYGLGYMDSVAVPHSVQPKTIPLKLNGSQQINSGTANTQNTTSAPKLVTPPPFVPNVDTQFLVVKFSPTTAKLYIDGVEQTATYGNWADELPVGDHTWKLEMLNYYAQDGVVKLDKSTKSVLDIKLQPDTNAVNISLIADDPNTEIWIDNIKKARGKWSGFLSKGTHNIVCRRDGFYDMVEDITIPYKSNSIKLQKLTPISGTLKIMTTPYGSKVFLNGKESGETPLIIKNLTPGDYMLRVVNQEGTIKDSIHKIEENQITIVNDDLPSLYYTDYSQVEPGDYFYADGTFTKGTKAIDKEFIGRVVTLETGPEAKRQGFTHGQIALEKSIYATFSTQEEIHKSLFPEYTTADINNSITNWSGLQKSGLDICCQSLLRDNHFYPAITQASELVHYNFASVPYLPSIEDIISSICSLFNIRKVYEHRFDYNSPFFPRIDIDNSDRSNIIFSPMLVSNPKGDYKNVWYCYAQPTQISIFRGPANRMQPNVKFMISF